MQQIFLVSGKKMLVAAELKTATKRSILNRVENKHRRLIRSMCLNDVIVLP